MQKVGHTRALAVSRSPSFIPMAIAGVLLCAVNAFVLRKNTELAEGIGYLSDCVALLGCAAAFFVQVRSASRHLQVRWLLMSAAITCAALGDFVSFVECCWPPSFSTRIFQVSWFTASEGMYLLAAILFFSGVARSVVLVDMLQALLFVVLRFSQTYSPTTVDHFVAGHLLIGQLVALFLFLVALIACFGAASREELLFLRIISCFFGLRLLAFFLSNQVSYEWLGYHNCSVLDLVGIATMAGFGLYLYYSPDQQQHSKVGPAHAPIPSTMVRNLMPSFLALVNLMIGLLTLRTSVPIAAAALSLTVFFYVTRTTLFQGEAAAEGAALQTRNEQLEGLATRDPLTGIGNRRSLASVYQRLQTSSKIDGSALLLMDIDHFKQANDRFGHLHGDNVLIALAQILEDFAEQVPGGHCARFGGDEFALLFPDVSARRAAYLAEELRSAFASLRFQVTDVPSTLSVGVAVLDEGERLPLEQLIGFADDALYRAKVQGRNRVAAA